jgi:hypothetical protein
MGVLSSWTESIILSLVAAGVLILIVANLNLMYNKNYAVPFSDSSGSEQLFINYQDTGQEQLKGGEVVLNAYQGITLKSSWGLITDAASIVWNFLSGGWIEQTVNAWNLGESGTALAKGIRIIYFLSLVFGLLYALFKIAL